MSARLTNKKGFVSDSRPKSFRLRKETQLALLELMSNLGGVTATAAIEYAITHAPPPSAEITGSAVPELERAKTALRRSVKRAVEFKKELNETAAMAWPTLGGDIKSAMVSRAQNHLEELIEEINYSLQLCEIALSELLPTKASYETLNCDLIILEKILSLIRNSKNSQNDANRNKFDGYITTIESLLALLKKLVNKSANKIELTTSTDPK